jgi:D-alanyl-D-alanine carboxypeptidase (penicillin-binding protein 5/6)
MKRLFMIVALFGLSFYVLSHGKAGDRAARVLQAAASATNDRVFATTKITAEAAVLVDDSTGDILFKKNADRRMYPASTTKIVTALVALERTKLNESVTVGTEVEPEAPDESRAGLAPGQRLKMNDLLEAMLLPSGNDAARAVAVHVARKEAGNDSLSKDEAIRLFAQLMNVRVRKAGAKHSHFVNPHGLHDRDHYTTAGDLALIAREAMQLAAFRKVVKTDVYNAKPLKGDGAVLTFTNRNKLLQKDSGHYFDGATGIKTGFTDEAGYCLVSSAARGNKRLISVVMQATDSGVYDDSTHMLDYGFEHLK